MDLQDNASPVTGGPDRVIPDERPEPQVSPLAEFWMSFKRNRLALVGAGMLIVIGLIAILAPVLAPYNPTAMNFKEILLRPGTQGHLLGTDDLGMDVLSRLIWGSRVSLSVAFMVIAVSLSIGIFVGSVAGYYGGWIDMVFMRLVDILYSFPFFILAISIMAVLGPSLRNVMIALAMVSWTGYARLLRGQFLALKEAEFVEGARAAGASDFRIITKYLLPNAIAPIIVQATLGMAGTILAASGLSFLGMGAQPPQPEWGAMLNAGRDYMRTAPYLTTYPGVAILLTSLAFNFVGDGLRDALDPRLKQ